MGNTVTRGFSNISACNTAECTCLQCFKLTLDPGVDSIHVNNVSASSTPT
ncbi:Uncharacterised protein [Vibrio cholerae]|nr:Uncharacterised protein [Vibrio cholerae]